MKIGIVGAGITGLALAASLQRNGIEAHVFERARGRRAEGAGITLAPNGLTALDALGLGEPFRKLQRRQRDLEGGLRSPDGRWLAKIPSKVTSRSLALGRGTLFKVLEAEIPSDYLHWGIEVSSVDAHSGELRYGDSGEAIDIFDLVVGADGLRSIVRRSCFDDPGIRYAGYNAWRAVVNVPTTVGSETWGSHARFGIVPLHSGDTYWFAVASGEEAQPSETRIDELHSTFADWHDPIPALLAETPQESVQFLPISELAGALSTFHNARAVLIGDAAHAMTPNLGQGACQGLEDAAVLATMLKRGELDLDRYDSLRVPRTQRIARQSRMLGALAHSGGPKLAAARNWILRAVPDALTAKQTAVIADWSVEI